MATKKRNSINIYFRSLCVAFLLMFSTAVLQGQSNLKNLSEESKISLLISSPESSSMFSIFGHCTLRICDPVLGFDFVFNYCELDHRPFYSTWKLTKGALESKLWVSDFTNYVEAMINEGRSMDEHVLNLSDEEKQTLLEIATDCARSRKDDYFFDPFKKNCTTFLYDMIKKSLNGEIVYSAETLSNNRSFREITNDYAKDFLWFIIGTNIVLGAPLEKPCTTEEALYIPNELIKALLSAKIKETGGDYKPVISSSELILERSKPEIINKSIFTPFTCSIILLLIIIALTITGRLKKINFHWIDYILYGFWGIFGVYLLLSFTMSARWDSFPNWNFVWIHPLHFLGFISVSKRFGKVGYYYHILNSALQCFMIIGVFFIPQVYNSAFIPLMLCLFVRSADYIVRYREIEENNKKQVKKKKGKQKKGR